MGLFIILFTMCSSHHQWVSAVGFSEAYNEAVRIHDSWRVKRYVGNVESWRLQYGDMSTEDVKIEGVT